jgi:serine protease Do
LRTYDVIVAVDGRPIESDNALIEIIAARSPGSAATVHLLRDGRPLEVTLKLAERPQRGRQDSDDADRPKPTSRRGPLLGLSVRQLDGRSTARFGLTDGTHGVVVSRVEPLSAAFDADIQRGHVLLEIDRQPILDLEDYRRLTDDARPGDVLAMYFYRPEINQRALETLMIDER